MLVMNLLRLVILEIVLMYDFIILGVGFIDGEDLVGFAWIGLFLLGFWLIIFLYIFYLF